MTKKTSTFSYCIALSALTSSGCLNGQTASQWVTPPGFHVSVFADSVGNAREMALGLMPGSNTTGGRAAARLATGRPVDVLQLPDGSILISDDFGNRILRVTYQR